MTVFYLVIKTLRSKPIFIQKSNIHSHLLCQPYFMPGITAPTAQAGDATESV